MTWSDRKGSAMRTSTGKSGSLEGNPRGVRVRSGRPLPISVLLTGAMVLTAAGLGLAGPVGAAFLISRHGAARGTAVTASLTLAAVAVLVALLSAALLFARAWSRRAAARPARASGARRVLPAGAARVRLGRVPTARLGHPA